MLYIFWELGYIYVNSCTSLFWGPEYTVSYKNTVGNICSDKLWANKIYFCIGNQFFKLGKHHQKGKQSVYSELKS